MSDLLDFIDTPIPALHKQFGHLPSEERKVLLAGISKLKASRSPLDLMEVASGGSLARAPHLEVLNQILVRATKEPLFVVVSLPVRHGKQSATYEKIPTVDGWKTHGTIEVGDFVYGLNGKPIKVLAKTKVDPKSPKIRVGFSDGSSLDVHPNHEWTLDIVGQKNLKTLETHELKNTSLRYNRRASETKTGESDLRWKYRLPHTQPLEFAEADLPIPPYTFGFWLGDGHHSDGTFCCAEEDYATVVHEILKEGEWVTDRKRHPDTDLPYGYIHKLAYRLRDLGVGGLKKKTASCKKLPAQYLFSSIEQRRALLAGLVDSDGVVEPKTGKVRIRSADIEFLHQIRTLVKSLGYYATVNIDEEPSLHAFSNGNVYQTKGSGVVQFTPHDNVSIGRLPRKSITRNLDLKVNRTRVSIVSVEDIEPEDGVCIQVDSPDGLYIAGDGLVPTHNSFLSSNYFPAWYMSQFPDQSMLMASYNLDTSATFTSKARDIFQENQNLFDYSIDKTRSAKALWGVEGYPNGGVRASGVGSSIIGHGGKIIICDDMYKDSEQAFSKNYNNKLREWWSQSMRSRLEPNGSIILVLARWAVDDLAGWLIDSAKEDAYKTQFIEFKIPALSTAPCEITGRSQAGMPLWPERYDVNGLRSLRADVGEMIWSCQYQQNPISMKDSMFAPDAWEFYPRFEATKDGKGKYETDDSLSWLHDKRKNPPADVQLVRFWDLSAGGKNADYLVGLLMAKDGEDNSYIIDVVRHKFTTADAQLKIEQTMIATSAADKLRWGNRVQPVIEDLGGVGKSAVANYKETVLKDYNVKSVRKTGKKHNEARPLSADQAAGFAYIVMEKKKPGYQAPKWTEPFISEMSECTMQGINSKHDDQIDAAAGAYNYLFINGKTRPGQVYSGKRLQQRMKVALSGGGASATQAAGQRASLKQIQRGQSGHMGRNEILKRAIRK